MLHAEARSASVNFLINDAKNIAEKGDYDRALVQLQGAKSIQGDLDIKITEDVKKTAARTFLSKGKELVIRTSPPDVAGSLSLLRKAVELDPNLPLNPEIEARQLATLRFVRLARDLLDDSIAMSLNKEEFIRKASSSIQSFVFKPNLWR